MHSLWSDGAQRPDTIVRAAAGRVHVVAITDHDEVRGAQDARATTREGSPWPRTPSIPCAAAPGDIRPSASSFPICRSTPSRSSTTPALFSWLYDAWAALRNVEWALPVTAGSDAYDVWYLGSAVTRFAGHTGADLRRALEMGRTRAHVSWSWSADKLPRHLRIQTRSLIRFLMLRGQRRRLAPMP